MQDAHQTSELQIEALRTPAVYPHDVDDVELIETHISWVLLAGEFAYKIKKPVDLGFVDFSTLEKRRQFCDVELQLNRRLCPPLYLGVSSVTGSIDSPRIDGDGAVIDYAVKMRRFSQDRLLSRMIAAGELTTAHVDRLAEEVADFHETIPGDRFGEHGRPGDVWEFAEENFKVLRNSDPATTDSRLIDELHDWSRQEAYAHQSDFEDRKRNGFVRECHGDMHLGNMIADGDDVRIFDCIEFNDRLRWIDVLSEVAFVVMDLEDRGRPDFARRFLSGYLERTGDYAGLSVLPFYLVYRAMVRAKVAALRLRQDDVETDEAAELRKERDGYLALARRYSQPAGPTLFITHGVSGSGKSTGSQHLIEDAGAVRIRSDVERKRMLGLKPHQATADLGEEVYSAEMTSRTYGRLRRLAEAVLRAGFSVVVDATFLRRRQRNLFRQLASYLKRPFRILVFEADVETLRQRITNRITAGEDASEADLEVLERQLAMQEPLGEDEQAACLRRAATTTQA